MLEFLLYMVFSVLESSALFYLGFKIFKIDLYPKEIVFAGLIMAVFSYFIRVNNGFAELDVLTQYALVFCFFWLLFRIHIFYSAIMTGMSYLLYMLFQSTFYLLLNSTPIFNLHFLGISIGIYFLQLVSALSAFAFGFYIGKKRMGFDFIPDKPNERIIIGSHEKILFSLSFPSIIVVALMIYFFERYSQFFIVVPLFYVVLLFGYLNYSIKKNRGEEF
ncbi:hypothetical protein A3842_08315 [Paenibacillus sp. P3E]|uniref:hypothetical protein n=1 Tax=Paenibacillus sp. P3E TaxID=1349435 RepID=UPI00093D4F7D|nr:hypothetical protein [Paenibacillus sp. P3E]OKP84227.1 hypothetical protein A3842_08315 [Paenibacillus sp. P3E]